MLSRGYGDRKRRFSDINENANFNMNETYVGPTDFLEAGTRGFLVTTLPDKEEFAVDDAIDLLRQAAIKLSGGIKAGKKTDVDKGYVKIDFMDAKDVTRIPNPDGEEEEDEEESETKTGGSEKTETKEEDSSEKKEDKASELNKDQEVSEKSEEKNEKDNSKMPEEKKEEMSEESKNAEVKESEQQKSEDKTEKEVEDSKKKEEETEKNEEKTEKDKEEKKKKPKWIYMKTTHKFKAYRTEMRNIMFIKSDYPDPCELAATAMDILLTRRFVTGDAVLQLIPAIGTCDFDLFQLEVMSRHVLAPLFSEDIAPRSFNIMLHDKMSEPGSHLMMEILRNCIWSLNPLAYQTSPLTEPELVIRLEVIGSKIVLCCMTNFIKYRQYSPTVLITLGEGEPEDDDLTHVCLEQRQEWAEEKERRRKQEEEYKEKKRRIEEEKKQREEAKRIKREQEAKEREERKAEKERRDAERQERLKKEREEREAARKAEEEKKAQEQAKSEEKKDAQTAEESKEDGPKVEKEDNQKVEEVMEVSEVATNEDKPAEVTNDAEMTEEPLVGAEAESTAEEVAQPAEKEVAEEAKEDESATKSSRSKRRRSKK